METHYLDYAATSPVLPQVKEAVAEKLNDFGNPSARHRLGQEAAKALEEDRAVLAGTLGCQPEEIIFTSGGTEGDNWAASFAAGKRRGHIITTAIEHAAVLNPIRQLQQKGFDVTYLPVDKTGHISPEDFQAALREDTVFVSLMLVNNELGTVQPVGECVKAAKGYNPQIFCHTDAVQGFLKVPFSVKELGVDALSLSGHKIGAPKGVGAFYLKKGSKLKPLILGGGQENDLRSGTESTLLIHAMAVAAKTAGEGMNEEMERLRGLQDYALERLSETLPDLKLISRGEAPHILAVTLPGYKSEVVVRFLSDRGVYISSGSACHKGKPSHVYAALRLPKPWLDGALRISFGFDTTEKDIDALADALREAKATLFTTLS